MKYEMNCGYLLLRTGSEVPCNDFVTHALHCKQNFSFLLGIHPQFGTILITAGGILNATCGNVPELIIALFALHKEKMEILKWSLLGSILSNLLLVLGSSLLCGGLANTGKERPLDRVRM